MKFDHPQKIESRENLQEQYAQTLRRLKEINEILDEINRKYSDAWTDEGRDLLHKFGQEEGTLFNEAQRLGRALHKSPYILAIESQLGEPVSPESKEAALDEYSQLLKEYQELNRKHRALGKRLGLEGTSEKIQALDVHRHDVHKNLIELARKLEKTKNDVLIDIIRGENSLAEYGLPEFSILKSSELTIYEGEVGKGHRGHFNVDLGTQHPKERTREEERYGMATWVYEKPGDFFGKDEILLVFCITPINIEGTQEPSDYMERMKRAEALSKVVNGKFFKAEDSNYHDTSAEIVGVLIPKENIEHVASIIRDRPKKYRLGKEFYS